MGRWQKIKAAAFARGIQVIRYSNEQDLVCKTHTAIAWIYYHEQNYDKGWEHINALTSVSDNNNIRESMNAQFTYIQKGKKAWTKVVEENIQNYTRIICREFVYAVENCMWRGAAEEALQLQNYTLSIMSDLCKNESVKPHCQGFYMSIQQIYRRCLSA